MTLVQNEVGGSSFPSTSSTVHRFSIETASESLNDLDLRIIPIGNSTITTTTTATTIADGGIKDQQRPLQRPKWVRKRILTENDEIVDQLVDVQTRSLSWSSRRPTRGWYLHLHSPLLPPKVFLPLNTPKRNKADLTGPKGTPLSFIVTTRLQSSKLSSLQEHIEFTTADQINSPQQGSDQNHFTSVNLNIGETTTPLAQPSAASDATVRSTGVESSTSSSKGHARRRSGGKGSTSINKQRIVSNPSSTPTVPEEESLGDLSQASTMVEEEMPAATTKSHSEPRRCTILLTDAVTFSSTPQKPSDNQQQQQQEGSWTKWALNILPQIVQPITRLGGSKSFSIFWTDAPSIQSESTTKKIEILRFVDQSAWLNWKSRQIGEFLIQQNAIETLNLDLGLWISAALAYLEFLEERDGYNASSDG